MHEEILQTSVASKSCCSRENKNATRTTKNITLEMNKFTENECMPNFELKLKFLENMRQSSHSKYHYYH